MIAWKLWTSVPTVALWEAVALVLEIDPRSLRHRRDAWMAGPGPWPFFERGSFPSQAKREDFDTALSFAERATNVAGPIHLRTHLAVGMNRRTAQVSLAEVVAFFVSCEWPDIPAPLLALVSTAADTAAEPVVPAPAPMDGQDGAKRWTPALLEELRAYRAAHGTKKAAEWAGVSESRVRELLPGDKPPPKGFSAFTHRAK